MATSKEKLIELLETLPAGRLERLVRISVVKLYGNANLPLIERAARPMNVAYVAADLKPDLLPTWASILGIDSVGIPVETLRDKVIDYVRHGPPTGAGGIEVVLAALRAGKSKKVINERLEERRREFTDAGLTAGEGRLGRLLRLSEEATKYGAGVGQFLAFISRDWPNPMSLDLIAVGACFTEQLIRDWHSIVLGIEGQALSVEERYEVTCKVSFDPKYDPDVKHRKLWKTRWESTGEDVAALAIDYALKHPEQFDVS